MATRPSTFDHSNSIFHSLPQVHIRNKSELRLLKSSNSSNQLNNTTIMTQLRSRNKRSRISVDPELAAAVVKGYLLPMFECKSKSIMSKSRQLRLGTDDKIHESKIQSGETVYSELKLTEQLKAEIDSLRFELEKAQREAKDCKQLLVVVEKESVNLKANYDNLEMNFELIKFQFSQQAKYLQ